MFTPIVVVLIVVMWGTWATHRYLPHRRAWRPPSRAVNIAAVLLVAYGVARNLPVAPLRSLARARANEERAYVVCAGDTSSAGGGYVVDPTGAVIGETLAGRTMAMSADMHRMLARWNDMAPGTNPVQHRRPESFGILFEAD